MLKCPVEVGDIFWRSTPKITTPDKLEVLSVSEYDGHTLIRALMILIGLSRKERRKRHNA